MRLLFLGALTLFFSAASFAQPTGEVESIGFNNIYRPGCWTPMVVRIKPNSAASGTYQIQIKQRDLDNDAAVFTRNISLTGSPQGGGRDQRFWMYFIPQPVNHGLPSPRDGASLRDIQDLIEVYLCTESGKQISQLPITAVPDSIDPPGGMQSRRGVRFVLAVNDGNSRLAWQEFIKGLDDPKNLLGVMEDVVIISVRSRELPENVLAYDAIDAVLWLDSDPAALRADGGQREQALDAYIRQGGHLVISQSANWQQTIAFGDWLPVDLTGMATRDDPEPLRTLAQSSNGARNRTAALPVSWASLKGPFRVATATPRDGAIVDEWMTLPADGKQYPFIARKTVGCGAVSWIAQDIGDPALTSLAKSGWLNVWEHVFDWKDDAVGGDAIVDADRVAYQPANGVDFGATLSSNLESKGRVGLFITLAVVFFILYWLVAGPGVFLFLTGRRKTQLSWFGFASVAVAATLLTVLLVKLLLRGPPELRHLSLVRSSADNHGTARSRFGLYIPRDGEQALALAKPSAAGDVSVVSALPIHPAHLTSDIENVGKLSYTVAVRDASSDAPASVNVPYRSSLKQFEFRWAGEISGRIEGVAQIGPGFARYIAGSLTNGTGRDLRDIYLAYKVHLASRSEDHMLYLPEWKAGETKDLEQQTRGGEGGKISIVGINDSFPGQGKTVNGSLAYDWPQFWESDLRGSAQFGETAWDDETARIRRAWPMLTIFGRLAPSRQPVDNARTRVELLRRGGRYMDLSPALAAGGLVIVAEAIDAPQPVGITVDGDAVAGPGKIIYQFVLPTRRTVDPPEVEAATQPKG